MQHYAIVGFGNSITLASEVPEDERWISIVGARLQTMMPGQQVIAINAGVGGNTSREGLARIDNDVIAHGPDCVLIEFGGNDATDDAARHVAPDEYVANLEAIRRRIADGTQARMALLTFPPVINAWHAWGNHPFHQPYGGIDEHVEVYRALTRNYAANHALPCIDIDRALRDACRRDGNGEYIKPDGVHLTAAGNQVVADTVVAALRDLQL